MREGEVPRFDVQWGCIWCYLPPTAPTPLWVDRRLWNDYLPATSFTGRRTLVRSGWYRTIAKWSLCKQTIRCFGLSLHSSMRDVSPGSCTNFPPFTKRFCYLCLQERARFAEFLQNCTERQIFERICSIIVLAFCEIILYIRGTSLLSFQAISGKMLKNHQNEHTLGVGGTGGWMHDALKCSSLQYINFSTIKTNGHSTMLATIFVITWPPVLWNLKRCKKERKKEKIEGEKSNKKELQ